MDIEAELAIEEEIFKQGEVLPPEPPEPSPPDLSPSESAPNELKTSQQVKVGNGIRNDILQCIECRRLNYNIPFYQAFGIAVCHGCQHEHRNKYKLISQTTAKDHYMLSQSEVSALKVIERPNPKRPTWSAMKLYLLSDVLEVVKQKLGSEILDIEEELTKRRTARDLAKLEKQMHAKRKKKESATQLPSLHSKKRKTKPRTRNGGKENEDGNVKAKKSKKKVNKKIKDDAHEHEFDQSEAPTKKCKHCDFVLEYEIL